MNNQFHLIHHTTFKVTWETLYMYIDKLLKIYNMQIGVVGSIFLND
jgi:hypothetical protein